MCPIQIVFCSLLRFSDIGPVLHSVEFISEEPPEKLPGHSPDAFSVVIILPLKSGRGSVDWSWSLWF